MNERYIVGEKSFAELVVWQLASPLSPSTHEFKYRLAFIVDKVCVLRYDNEAGKGDHRHFGKREMPYRFTTPEQLLEDFWKDVKKLQ